MKMSAQKVRESEEEVIARFFKEVAKLPQLAGKDLAIWPKHETFPGPGGIGFYREHELFLTEAKYRSRFVRLGLWVTFRPWPVIMRTTSVYGKIESFDFEDALLAMAAQEVYRRYCAQHPFLRNIEMRIV